MRPRVKRLPKFRWIVIPALILLSINAVHGVWHIANMEAGWNGSGSMAWADGCLAVGELTCHTVVVLLGEFVLPLWIVFWALQAWKRVLYLERFR